MRLKLIACKALSRELCWLCAKSPNNIDITFLRQSNHNSPELLRRVLQDEINLIESGNDYRSNDTRAGSAYMNDDFDAILLGYGLCSNGIIDIYSSKYKLVIPRAHDCITFLLGSKEKYTEYFNNMPGTYWYTMSWVECGATSGGDNAEVQAQYYRDKGYDEEDIAYLMEAGGSWVSNYNTAAYIKMPFYDREEYQEHTKRGAAENGWDYKLINGDMGLMEAFINGEWDDSKFLVVPPGHKVTATYDDGIIGYAGI